MSDKLDIRVTRVGDDDRDWDVFVLNVGTREVVSRASFTGGRAHMWAMRHAARVTEMIAGGPGYV